MHSVIEAMLSKYEYKTEDDYKNALKEVIQEIALLGLFRAGFFDIAACYGGTALRIFYGLPRFSEDIDFSLLMKTEDFDIRPYCKAIQAEMAAYGFDFEVAKKERAASTIESAFIKGNTRIHFLKITSFQPPVSGVHRNELLKIKLEVDADPPAGANYEVKYHLAPIPFSVRIYSPGSLFAGKLHAVLCRNWNSKRIKGRDLYDYVWYLSRQIPVNIFHLEQRMKQTGHLKPNANLTTEALSSMLYNKFQKIDYEQAKRDALPFVRESAELSLWSAEFFMSITREKLKIER